MAVEYLVNSTEKAATIFHGDETFLDATTTNAPSYLRPDQTLLRYELTISGIIIINALFGNLVVVNTLWQKRKSLTRMHFFIYHLCIADILSALLSQFPLFVWDITFLFYGPDILCRLVKFFQLFPIYLSSYVLILTAFDRYLAICHPLLGLRGNQKLRMRLMVAVVWALSAVFSSPQLYFFKLQYVNRYGGYSCWVQMPSLAVARAYVTIFTLAVFIIPSVLLAVIYGLICSTVWQNMAMATGHKKVTKTLTDNGEETEQCTIEMKKNGHDSHSKNNNGKHQLYRSHTTEARVSRAKIKTVKMTLTIVTVYVICWTPFFFSLLWGAWGTGPLHAWVDALFNILANINACTNPWIYLVFSGNVRGALRDLLWFCSCCQASEHHPVPSTTAQGDDNSGTRFAHSHAGLRTATTCGQEHDIDNKYTTGGI